MTNNSLQAAFVVVEDGVLRYGLTAEVGRDEVFRLVDELDRLEAQLADANGQARSRGICPPGIVRDVAPVKDEFSPTLRLVVAN